MTSVVQRPALNPLGAGRWYYDVDDLALAGVRLNDDQLDLLDPSSQSELVIVALALPAPEDMFVGHTMASAAPLEVKNSPAAAPSRVPAPFLAEVKWDAQEEVENRLGPFWRRFPSLPVQLIYPDVDFWPINFAEDDIRHVRIWDAAVCGGTLATEMLEFGHAFTSSWNPYIKLGLFWAATFNELDGCALTEELQGIGSSHHQHYQVPSPNALFEIRCSEGEQLYNRLEHELFVSGYRGSYPKPFELPNMGDDLDSVWRELTRTAPAAAGQAMQVSPSIADDLSTDEWEGGRPWAL